MTRLLIDIDHFRARILQDALTEATAQYWLRRAEQFEEAAPRLDEYRGTATRDELNDAWMRCHEAALACRNHARFLRAEAAEAISEEVLTVLGEVP